MTAVFSHGRLRLYLLKLLAEGPKHGYELIRLLENRFLGLYAPSAGTIYPRLARLEAEGLVGHAAAGGRKVYEITDAGRAELDARADELAALESEIHASVADLSTLAQDIEREVSGSVRDIKRELREATRQARATGRPRGGPGRDWEFDWGGREDWRTRWSDWRQDAGTRAGSGGRQETGTRPEAGAGERDRPRGGRAGSEGAEEALSELAAALSELARDVGRMAREVGVAEPEIRTATAVVTSALTELRRLLRR
jgi:DNA-binding PadR family transcriptional regulator